MVLNIQFFCLPVVKSTNKETRRLFMFGAMNIAKLAPQSCPDRAARASKHSLEFRLVEESLWERFAFAAQVEFYLHLIVSVGVFG